MAARMRIDGAATSPELLAQAIAALDATNPEALHAGIAAAARAVTGARGARLTVVAVAGAPGAVATAGELGDAPADVALELSAAGPALARIELFRPREDPGGRAALRVVVAHAAQALENARLRLLAGEERRRGRRLADAVAALRRASDPADVAERVVDEACAVTEAPASVLIGARPAGRDVLARHGLPPLSAHELLALFPPESRRALGSGVAAVAWRLAEDDPLRGRGFAAVALVGLGGRAAQGVLAVLAADAGALGDRELDALGDLAAHASAAMTSASLRRQVEEFGAIDALTGLFNARYLEHRLEQEVARAMRTGHPVSVAVLALDGAAARRRDGGDGAGNEELRRLSSVVAAHLRAMDVGCRLAEDELLVLLPDATGLEAYGVAERLRSAVAADRWLEGRALSAGIATLPDGAATPSQLLARARTALGHALRHGGDRCFLYHPEVDQLLRSEDEERRATQNTLVETVTTLAATVDGRHPATREHGRTVARIAALVAFALGFSAEQVEDVRLAGLVHDVGKMGVDEEVLLSPGVLTPAQWEEVRQHPELGQRMLAGSRLEPLGPWVRHHHERMDGGGYPDGLAGEAIPIESRIIAVAEALDAMTSGGPHRAAMPPAEALAELRRCAGSQFDPRVVDVLLRLHSAGRLGAAA